MAALLRGLSSRFVTPIGTPNDSTTDLVGFRKAPEPSALFPKTTPEVDGEDCLHDCASCTIKYPRKFEVDEEDKLYGHVNGWSTHLIVATGKADWVRDIADEKGSVMEAVGKSEIQPKNGVCLPCLSLTHDTQKHNEERTPIWLTDSSNLQKMMLSASNMPVPHTSHSDPEGQVRTTVLLLPAFKYIENVTPDSVPDLIQSCIDTAPTNTTPLDSSSSSQESKPEPEPEQEGVSPLDTIPKTLPSGLEMRNCPHKYLILLCSHGTRDARCGQSAPLLRKEFERHLRPLGLYRDLEDERPGGVGIYFINHVGGHKFAANVMIYRRGDGGAAGVGGMAGEQAAQCMWLARVKPSDVENLVRYTVLQGKLVQPDRQLRGGFDRSRRLTSW